MKCPAIAFNTPRGSSIPWQLHESQSNQIVPKFQQRGRSQKLPGIRHPHQRLPPASSPTAAFRYVGPGVGVGLPDEVKPISPVHATFKILARQQAVAKNPGSHIPMSPQYPDASNAWLKVNELSSSTESSSCRSLILDIFV